MVILPSRTQPQELRVHLFRKAKESSKRQQWIPLMSLLLGDVYGAPLLSRYADGFNKNRMDVFRQFDASGF